MKKFVIKNNTQNNLHVQTKLLNLGYTWRNGSNNIFVDTDADFLAFNGKELFYCSHTPFAEINIIEFDEMFLYNKNKMEVWLYLYEKDTNEYFGKFTMEVPTTDIEEIKRECIGQLETLSVVRRSCIDFAEWILKQGFEKYQENGKCWWGKFHEDDAYSTEVLYEMWSDNYA